jgi:hypothetical protein
MLMLLLLLTRFFTTKPPRIPLCLAGFVVKGFHLWKCKASYGQRIKRKSRSKSKRKRTKKSGRGRGLTPSEGA